jgi:hypothetical protein
MSKPKETETIIGLQSLYREAKGVSYGGIMRVSPVMIIRIIDKLREFEDKLERQKIIGHQGSPIKINTGSVNPNAERKVIEAINEAIEDGEVLCTKPKS